MSSALLKKSPQTTVTHPHDAIAQPDWWCALDDMTPVQTDWRGRVSPSSSRPQRSTETSLLMTAGPGVGKSARLLHFLDAFDAGAKPLTTVAAMTSIARDAEFLIRDLATTLPLLVSRVLDALDAVVLPVLGGAVALAPPAAREGAVRELVAAPSQERAASRAYGAFRDLRHWLRASHTEIADMVGVKRTTPYSWGRGHDPRPEAARTLYQAHAVAAAIVQRLGEDAGMRWLSDEDPARRRRFLEGDVARLQREARRIVFTRRRRSRPGSWSPDYGEDDGLD